MIWALLLTALGAERHTIDVNGLERSFWIEVPANAKKPGKRSAVVVFHGAGPDRSDDKGAKFAKHTKMARAAAEYGAVTVFPNGVQGGWYPPKWAPEGVDDVAFAKALRKVLVRKYGVDAQRIGAVGFSSGGHMAMQWACNDPHIGGIAVVGANLSQLQSEGCKAPTPLPTMFVLGRKDKVNPYEGGQVNGVRTDDRKDAVVLSAAQSGQFFADANACKKSAVRSTLYGPTGRAIGTRDKFRGCQKGKVEVISGPVGHVWPLGGTKAAHKGASAYIAKFLRKRVWSKKLRK